MKKIVVDNCPACEPVNAFVNALTERKFEMLIQRIEDYHFHQLYFKFKGDFKLLSDISKDGFSNVDNKFICNCHWSTIEIV